MKKKQANYINLNIDVFINKKNGVNYFLINVLKAFSKCLFYLSILAFILLLIVSVAIYYLHQKSFPNSFQVKTYSIYILLVFIIGIILYIVSCFLLKRFAKNSFKIFDEYFNSFNKYNVHSFLKDKQTFYYIDQNRLYVYQNLEKFLEIDLQDIKQANFDIDLIHDKRFKREILKKTLIRKPTLIGVSFKTKDNLEIILSINLLLKNCSTQISLSKKNFLENRQICQDCLESLKNDLFSFQKKVSNIKKNFTLENIANEANKALEPLTKEIKGKKEG